METTRVSATGQATIPKRVLDAAHIKEGDLLAFDLEQDGRVIVRRVEGEDEVYLKALESTLTEWNSPEDEEAWRDL